MSKRKTNSFNIFLFAVFAVSLGQGMGLGGGFASFFYHEAYQINGFVRGAIEIPREVPGILCIFLLLFLLKRGDIFSSIIAQIISVIVAFILAFWTPPFWLMLTLLSLNSLGMHSFFALQDAVALKLSEASKEEKGKNLGKVKSAGFLATALSAALVYFGSHYNFFTFSTHFKLIFLISGIFYSLGLILLIFLSKTNKKEKTFQTKKVAIWRAEFIPYYILSGLAGAQKQVNATFSIWMIISVFAKKADFMGILIAIGSSLSIFWVLGLGKLTDKTSPKPALILNACIAIAVALLYAFLGEGTHIIWVAAVFVLDVLGVNLGFARSLYVKKICNASELTPVLSSGIASEHLIALIVAFIGGWAWQSFGFLWVFIGFAIIQLISLTVSIFIKQEK